MSLKYQIILENLEFDSLVDTDIAMYLDLGVKLYLAL